jgi:cation:H+ antiporter
MTYLLIPIGFVLLFFGGDALVRGAVGLARHLGVSPMLIGATIVAYGTTAPELFVSLDAAFKDAPGIAIGNVVGSNICNFLLILGMSALVWPISLERASSLYLTSTILFGSTMLLLLVAWDGNIERWQGGLMVGLLMSLTVYNFRVERRRPAGQDIFTEEAQEFTDKAPQTIPKSVMVILIGLVGVVFGADFLVKGAVTLARDAGIPQEVIGLTVVALGTSLPELATALVAAWRKHSDVALGTVFGANIYNILGIMGVVAAVTPVPIPSQMLRFDLWFLLAITFMLGAWIRLLPRITRYSGFGFLTLYISYIVWQYLGP